MKENVKVDLLHLEQVQNVVAGLVKTISNQQSYIDELEEKVRSLGGSIEPGEE